MKNLKLNKFEANKLNNREMKDVNGGSNGIQCGCGCRYEGNGGSSSFDNGHANYDRGLFSGGAQVYWLEEVVVTP